MSSRCLTDLPLEMFWLVVENLDCEKDINALSQVSRGIYVLLNPYLYRKNVYNDENSALAWGAYHGQEATVRKALEQGAWLEFNCEDLPEPITLAAIGGHANIVKLLLDHGVDPVSAYGNDRDAALARDHAEVLQVLIEDGGFVPRAWDFFNTACDRFFESLKVLVRACPQWAELAQSEYSDILGITIDGSAASVNIARFLIDSGSPVNCGGNYQDNPLDLAAHYGNIEMVKLLLSRGADPDLETPLWSLRCAAERGHVKVAELLLENIDIQSKITGGGDDQFWLLYSAAACGFEKIVRACLNAVCDANRRLDVQYCPFHVDDTCRTSDGRYKLTPLDWARGRSHSAVVRLLENEALAS
ncbi:uncharacterized protein N7479_005474 [Penicillium vulpinum]|uniref:uncharacterized protein n=1 Tax=Penicillium vulpinum TaxID=29845 RepID=UPI002546CC5E|nr:uncharacterized protein N7479_005474 [Penicillium vulpinum]KAJ5958324.1 hypothetical protein N7479_005474 [Penicillium vulpinum]